MPSESDNLVVQFPRPIDGRVHHVEAGFEQGLSIVQRCLDRIEDRLRRIEKRPDLVGAGN